MSLRPHAGCTTETITLLVNASEQWKVRSDDEIVFGKEQQVRSTSLGGGKFLDDGNILVRDLGDNTADEGVLSQSGRDVTQGGVVLI
jgi:hypothetical protein